MPEDADTRRALVQRIVASSSFVKSKRLSDFLKYVYNLAEKGRFDDINEQRIGTAVFKRSHGYDPGVDSIVRSHASRLRHRLKEYFEQEGQDEVLCLTIPRGSYIPVFEPRSSFATPPETATLLTASKPQREEFHRTESYAALNLQQETATLLFPSPSSLKTIRHLRIALTAGAAIISFLVALLFFDMPFPGRPRAGDATSNNLLWKQFAADPAARTVIVSSDSGLVMYQHLTGQTVSLASYVSRDYLKYVSSRTASEDIVRKFSTRRYTPALGLSVFDRMTRIFGHHHDRLSSLYARDLRVEDLKLGNVILLGTSESNPWVQLFEPSLNFYFQDDMEHDKSRILNRHPLAGEAAHYDSTPNDSVQTIYGVVAYRPNMFRSGRVLILEGQTMAGTQTAADFVFDDTYLVPFLTKIRRPDGSLPYFEVLLRSSSLGGQSSHIDLIAYRVANQ